MTKTLTYYFATKYWWLGTSCGTLNGISCRKKLAFLSGYLEEAKMTSLIYVDNSDFYGKCFRI